MASWDKQLQDLVKLLSPWKYMDLVKHPYWSSSKEARTTLQACTSHHTHHKNTWVAPLERWKNPKQNTCRAPRHIMHTIIMAKMTKVLNGVADLTIISSSPLLTAFRASRWAQMKMMQWNEMMYSLRWTFWYAIFMNRSYGCKVTEPRTYAHGLKFQGLRKKTSQIWI